MKPTVATFLAVALPLVYGQACLPVNTTGTSGRYTNSSDLPYDECRGHGGVQDYSCGFQYEGVALHYWMSTVTMTVATLYQTTLISGNRTSTRSSVVRANATTDLAKLASSLWPTANGQGNGPWSPRMTVGIVTGTTTAVSMTDYNGKYSAIATRVVTTFTAPTPFATFENNAAMMFIVRSCGDGLKSTSTCSPKFAPSPEPLPDAKYTTYGGDVFVPAPPQFMSQLASSYPFLSRCSGMVEGSPVPKVVVTELTRTIKTVSSVDSPLSDITTPASAHVESSIPGDGITPSTPTPTPSKTTVVVAPTAHIESSMPSPLTPETLTAHMESSILIVPVPPTHQSSHPEALTAHMEDSTTAFAYILPTTAGIDAPTTFTTPSALPYAYVEHTTTGVDAPVSTPAKAHIESSIVPSQDTAGSQPTNVPQQTGDDSNPAADTFSTGQNGNTANSGWDSSSGTNSNSGGSSGSNSNGEGSGSSSGNSGSNSAVVGIASWIMCGMGNCGSVPSSTPASQPQTPAQNPQQNPQVQPQGAVFTLAGSTYTAGPTGVVIGSVTIAPGALAATVNGQQVSIGSQNVVVGGSTIPYSATANVAAAAAPTSVFTVGGQAYTAGPSGVVVGLTTLKPGAVATIGGQQVSVGSLAFVVGSSTIQLPAAQRTAPPAAVVVLGGTTYTAGPSGLVIGSVTIKPGSETTMAGQRISVASTGVVVGGSTIMLSSPAATAAPTRVLELTLDGHVFTAGPSGLVSGSSMLKPGTVTTVNGQQVSVGSSAVVVGSSTLPFSTTITPSAVVTLNGQVYTAGPSGLVIGSITLKPGTVTTIDGQQIAVGGSDIIVGSSTIHYTTGADSATGPSSPVSTSAGTTNGTSSASGTSARRTTSWTSTGTSTASAGQASSTAGAATFGGKSQGSLIFGMMAAGLVGLIV